MGDKFNFYDFVGYVIPGAAMLALIYWLYVGLFDQPAGLTVDSLGESLIFLAAAYFVGHVAQALGLIMTRRLGVRAFAEYDSQQLLRADDPHFTPAFRANLVTAIAHVFNLTVASPGGASGQSPEILPAPAPAQARTQACRDAFDLCYSLIVQEGADAHTELFNGIYGLLRGMFTVLCLAIPVAIAIIIRNVLARDQLQWGLGIAVLVAAVLALPPVIRRAGSFSELFAVSVYRGFYAWYCAKRLDGGSGAV